MTDSENIILTLHRVERSFGTRTLFEDVTLSFLQHARIGVIGPNGQGKSTLLRIMAGEDSPSDGEVVRAPGITLGYVAQEPTLNPELTVRENLDQAVAPIRDMLKRFEELSARLAEPMDDAQMQAELDKLNRLQDQIEAKDAWELDRHMEQAMQALSLPPADAPVTHLSGGEQRRVALCRALLEHPDVLLLDEPTNHLDADTVAWLERHLESYNGTVIVITHDRYFLDNVVGWMLEIDRGSARPYRGNYSSYLEQHGEYYRQRQKTDNVRAKLIAKELEWIHTNPKGRSKKNKARVQRYDDLVREHQRTVQSDFRLHIPFTRRLGDFVVKVEGVHKSYDGRKILHDLTFELEPGAILGIIGSNGTGKTTLLRMLVGQEHPDAGGIQLGASVDLCYLDQSRDQLNPENSVLEEITGGADHLKVGEHEVAAKAYVSRFQFRGRDQDKLLKDLSGGERNRVQMAKMLARGGNLILLDEPTNDLDLPTLRNLEQALLEFPGSCVVVTHDRWFLDRIATHVLAFLGDGTADFFPGNYEAYREWRREQREAQGLAAESPKSSHKKFSGS